MKKLKTIPYRSYFNIEVISILDDYLDNDSGSIDNNVTSYIKVNVEKFLSFLDEQIDSYKKDFLCSEAVETIKKYFLNLKENNVLALGLK